MSRKSQRNGDGIPEWMREAVHRKVDVPDPDPLLSTRWPKVWELLTRPLTFEDRTYPPGQLLVWYAEGFWRLRASPAIERTCLNVRGRSLEDAADRLQEQLTVDDPPWERTQRRKRIKLD